MFSHVIYLLIELNGDSNMEHNRNNTNVIISLLRLVQCSYCQLCQ